MQATIAGDPAPGDGGVYSPRSQRIVTTDPDDIRHLDLAVDPIVLSSPGRH